MILHEFQQAPRVGMDRGAGSGPWGSKELDMTE